MQPIVRSFGSDFERAQALEVRRRVLIEEHGVRAALEHDEHDATCEHLIALADGRVVGAARYRRTERGVKLERVAVLAELRGHGVGSALVRHAIARVPAHGDLYIHAQHSALGFWERMGFVAEGPFVLQPLDLIARLVAAIPPPRFHMTRFHGLLSSHCALRSLVVPKPELAAPVEGAPLQLSLFQQPASTTPAPTCDAPPTAPRYQGRHPWAQLLRHVFGAHRPQSARKVSEANRARRARGHRMRSL